VMLFFLLHFSTLQKQMKAQKKTVRHQPLTVVK